MALKNYRPLTPIQRFKQTPAFDEITKWRPTRALIEPKKKSGGRNNYGRLTSRHIGGGHKQNYRKVDFKRRKHGVSAEVMGIEYDPNRSARIALIKYTDGDLSYIRARNGDEPDRPSDGRRSGQIEGRRRPASSGKPMGTIGQRIQNPQQTQAERPLHYGAQAI